MTLAQIIALSGESSLGLSTIVQPAASAGSTLHAIWLIGVPWGDQRAHTDRFEFDPGCAERLLEGKALQDIEHRRDMTRADAACFSLDIVIGAPISTQIASATSA